MIQSLATAATEWIGPRPLKALTKDQLFKYPEADPSQDAYWDFCKETLARVIKSAELVKRASSAAQVAANAERNIGNAQAALTDAEGRYEAARAEQDATGMTIHRAKIQSAKQNLEALARFGAKAAKDALDLQASIKSDGYTVSAEETEGYFRHRHQPEWSRILTRYNDGDYFYAQKYGAISFLGAASKEQIEDEKNYFYVEGIARLVGQLDNERFKNMRALWLYRIMPGRPWRSQYISKTGSLKVADLGEEPKRKYWKWFRDYNRATVFFKWLDDSGVAFDERANGFGDADAE